MRKLVVLASAALLALPLSVHAQAQGQGNQGQGASQGKSGDRNKQAGAPGKPAKPGNNAANNQSADRNEQAAGQGRGEDQGKRASPANGQGQAQRATAQRGADATRPQSEQINRGRDFRVRTIENGRYTRRDPGFQGCPPGLATKDNGCLPPGQARKLSGFAARDARWFRYSDWFNTNRGDDWRIDRGYAYRVDPRTNLVVSSLPLLGGALFGGNGWPQSYTSYAVPPYYDRFYGQNGAYDYRYADGAVFAVNPQTQVIQSVAGLLTGDNWAIGSPMPLGYDLYNVPYGYRSQYADSASSWYRYNDGYVYRVDPTTQLVSELIELVV